ncbi:MAG TPA: DUF4239 domain-containing protein [Mycobacteriales bacterium]|nr:DUF4239 domain-containing protein [Mycobacteriales bacterium]
MTSWLTSHLPTWALALFIIGGLTLISVLGCLVARRRFPALTEGIYNDLSGILVGVFAAIYGVLLAFVIVILWENRGTASNAVNDEAAALSQVVQDSQGLPKAPGDAVAQSVGAYVHAVVTDEWPKLAHGMPSAQATTALAGLHATLRAEGSHVDSSNIYFSDAVTSFNQASTSRRARLAASESGLPPLFMILIVIGAFVFVPLTYLFGIRAVRAQLLFVGVCAAMIAVGLFLTVVLNRPFAGAVGLDPGAFQQGTLAQFWGAG